MPAEAIMLTDYLENLWLPVFKRAEAEGNTEEALRLLGVLYDTIGEASRKAAELHYRR